MNKSLHPNRTPKHLMRLPIGRFMAVGELRRVDIASRSKVSMPSLAKVCTDSPMLYGMQLDTLLAISNALGCSLVELLPQLAKRPKTGLLWERGVFREKGDDPRLKETHT